MFGFLLITFFEISLVRATPDFFTLNQRDGKIARKEVVAETTGLGAASVEEKSCHQFTANVTVQSFDFHYEKQRVELIVPRDERFLLMVLMWGSRVRVSYGLRGDLKEKKELRLLKYVSDVRQSPFNADFVLLSGLGDDGDQAYFARTRNGGESWHLKKAPFGISESLEFNNKNYLLLKTKTRQLWCSFDFAESWLLLKEKVNSYKWSENGKFIFFTKHSELYRLQVKHHGSNTLTEKIKSTSGVDSFGLTGRYLFISRVHGVYKRVYASLDYGLTWSNVRLPPVTANGFYAVVGLSKTAVYMHVHDGNTSDLYFTNDSGMLFERSLENHSYQNGLHRVVSLPETFVANRQKNSGHFESVITFDGGVHWKTLDADCENATCKLQIHDVHSEMPGLILAHGHYGEHIDASKSDVFVSLTGGHSWFKSLNGYHIYETNYNSSLIFAVSAASSFVLLSTNYGKCWKRLDISRQNSLISLTKNSLFSAVTGHELQVFTVDLNSMFKRNCTKDDFEEVSIDYPLHGAKLISRRHRNGSLCFENQDHRFYRLQPSECTPDDFICDYGFSRTGPDCVLDNKQFRTTQLFKVLCQMFRATVSTNGYRQRPGNKCKGGFAPKSTVSNMVLSENCKLFFTAAVKATSRDHPPHNNTLLFKLFIVSILVLLTFTVTIFWYFIVYITKNEYKFIRLRSPRSHACINLSDTENDEEDETSRIFSKSGLSFETKHTFRSYSTKK